MGPGRQPQMPGLLPLALIGRLSLPPLPEFALPLGVFASEGGVFRGQGGIRKYFAAFDEPFAEYRSE
jgi:hypothetical protein